MTRRILVDTEWTAPPWSDDMELMWVGLADEDGHSWYGVSAEAEIDPTTNDFISGLIGLVTPEQPRMTRDEMAAAIVEFCGEVNEFWAWVPTLEGLRDWFGLAEEEAAELYPSYWDFDLQMLRSVVQPWPEGWPDRLRDLNAAAVEAKVEIPPRAEDHFHPRVHAEWNRDLLDRIKAAGAS